MVKIRRGAISIISIISIKYGHAIRGSLTIIGYLNFGKNEWACIFFIEIIEIIEISGEKTRSMQVLCDSLVNPLQLPFFANS